MLSRYCCLSWIPIFPTLAAVIFCSSLLRGFGDWISLFSGDLGCCRCYWFFGLQDERAAPGVGNNTLDKVWWASVCKCCADTGGACVLFAVCSTLSQRINHEEPMAHTSLNMTTAEIKGQKSHTWSNPITLVWDLYWDVCVLSLIASPQPVQECLWVYIQDLMILMGPCNLEYYMILYWQMCICIVMCIRKVLSYLQVQSNVRPPRAACCKGDEWTL